MSIEGELRQRAREIATHVRARAAQLSDEYLEAQKRAIQLKLEFDLSNRALKRTTDYQVMRGVDYLCPWCWIERGIENSLYPVPGTTRTDIFKCSNGHDFTVAL
jgi:hypothetical protein